jgi:hypothetical protein
MNEERFVIDFISKLERKKREEEKGSCILKNSFLKTTTNPSIGT